MNESSANAGPFSDGLDDANRRIRGRAVVLSHLFEALSSPKGQPRALSDFGSQHEVEFWAGLRDLMGDILSASEDVQQHADGLRWSTAGSMPPAAAKGDAMSDHQARSVAELAADLARDVVEGDLGRIIEDRKEGWDALVKAVRAEKFPRDEQPLGNDERLALYSKVITTLPVEHRSEFRRLTVSRTIDEIIERHAAFELGRQIERHAREVRR